MAVCSKREQRLQRTMHTEASDQTASLQDSFQLSLYSPHSLSQIDIGMDWRSLVEVSHSSSHGCVRSRVPEAFDRGAGVSTLDCDSVVDSLFGCTLYLNSLVFSNSVIDLRISSHITQSFFH